MALTIGILETGLTPTELIDEHSSYGNMFIDLLRASNSALNFEVFRVIEDQFPDDVDTCDCWVITGSRHGVYENMPWMRRLKDFLQDCKKLQKKVIGICFGHQILAEAMGGKVEKSEKGWAIGPHTYHLNEQFSFTDGESNSFTINALHQDQVVLLPQGAKIMASSAFCPYAGLSYGDWAISLQSHPEFSDTYEAALIELRRMALFSSDLAEAALTKLASSDVCNEGARVARWMNNFFK